MRFSESLLSRPGCAHAFVSADGEGRRCRRRLTVLRARRVPESVDLPCSWRPPGLPLGRIRVYMWIKASL
jgi:hypothetical protein